MSVRFLKKIAEALDQGEESHPATARVKDAFAYCPLMTTADVEHLPK